MKYEDLVDLLPEMGYERPTSEGIDVVDVQRAKAHRCPKCGGEMRYVIAMSSPDNPKYNYRGFLVCRQCSEVVETHGYDW
jgi:uncharacterized protein with PIN domain